VTKDFAFLWKESSTLKIIARILLIVLLILPVSASAAIQTTSILSHVSLSGPISNGQSTSSASLVGTGFGGVHESKGTWLPYFLGKDYRGRDTDQVTVIQADISGLVNTKINSATLEWVTRMGSENGQQQVSTFVTHGVVGGSGISTDSIPGGVIQSDVFGTNGWMTNGGFNQIDITSMIQQRVDSGADWLGLYFEPVGETEQSTYTWDDADYAQVVLRIDYDTSVFHNPEPTSAMIWLIIGVFAVLIKGRHRVA
jgi:hypothetical protein